MNMKRIILVLTSICALLAFNVNAQLATCDSEIEVGQNLIVNGDFESGDIGFRTDQRADTLLPDENGILELTARRYLSWNKGEGPKQPSYSSAGDYWVTDDIEAFNRGSFYGEPHGGDNVLAVDGRCVKGSIIWEQDVNITSDTRYYFSVWIASLKAVSIASLTFQIGDSILGEQIQAPNVVNQWNNFVDSSWYSGSIEGLVTIRIRNNQVDNCDGDGGGNDFALDDISFSPGCFYGGPGQIADFGDDVQTLCGSSTGELTLEAAVTPGVNYQYRWAASSGGGATNSLTVTEPGIYALCMTSNGSCATYKEVEVTSDFSISLGDDVDLCSPATTTLVTDYLKGEKYDWFKDGEALGQFRNETSATVNEVGTYKLVVTDANASCGSKEDEVIVSSSTIQAVNGYFCPGEGLAVDLSITNMLSDPANYKWYSDETLTTEVATGGTFTTPNNLTETTTYWVKDESSFDFTFGPSSSGDFFGDGNVVNSADSYIVFDVHTDIFLDSVTLYLVWAGWGTSQNVSVRIQDWTGGVFNGDVIIANKTFDPICADGSCHCACPLVGNAKREMPLGIMLEAGKTYRIANIGAGQIWQSNVSGNDLSQFNTNSQFLDITGLIENGQSSNKLVGFFDWKITAGSPCDPIEVQAIYDPVRCTNCESPTDLTIDVAGLQPLKCSSDQVTLTANVAGGIGTWDYAWTLNGQPTGTNSNTIVVSKADAGDFAVSVEEQLEGDLCTASSLTETITTEDPAEASVTLNADLSQAQCLVGGVVATATDVNITSPVYAWTINGDNTQSQNLNSLTLNVASGDIVQVTVTGTDECGDPISEIANATIVGEEEITPTVSINGANGLCDTETAALTATITPLGLTNITYDWAVTGGLTSADPTYNVDLNDGDVIDLIVTFGGSECLTSTTASGQATADVTASGDPSVTISVTENDLCADKLPMNFSIAGTSVGGITPTFEWFVDGQSQGTGTVFNFNVENGNSITAEMTSSAVCATFPVATSQQIVANVIALVDAEVSISGSGVACAGQDITLSADVLPLGTTGTYDWTVNGNSIGETGAAYTSNNLSDGDQISVVFTPTVACPVNPTVEPASSVSISIENPSVSITSLYEGDLCSGKDNGYKVSSASLGGTSPSYSWTLNNDPTELSTDDFIERADFKEGDVVKLVMTPNPANGCPVATAEATLGVFQEQFEIALNITDSVLCNGSTLTLRASALNGGADPKYQWYKNDVVMVDDTMSSISVTGDQDDEYKVVFESSLYCIDDTLATDSITLTVIDVPFAEAGPDIVLEDYSATELDGNGSSVGDVDYWWTSSDTLVYPSMVGRETIKTTATPIEKLTTFYLKVSRTIENVTCSSIDSTIVTVDFDFPIPNAFSPNGDGANDVFEIDNLDKLDSFTLQIYNRWGSLLYEQKSATDFWDGTRGGNPVPASTYFFIFTYELDGESNTEDGYISLIR